MKKNRLRIIFIVFLIAFLILLSRLFQLTIVEGDKFREFSDNNRMKQINIDASRGIIYDRNGQELASNKAMYNLNAYKDRFSSLDKSEKKEVLTKLIKILEEDGVNYLSNYQLSIYEFVYENKEDYFREEKFPVDRVIDIIKNSDLLEEILNSKLDINKDTSFAPINMMKDYLIMKGKEVPVSIKLTNELEISFVKNDKYEKLLKNKAISATTKPLDYIISIIKEDDSYINYMMSHPLARKLVYKIMQDKSLTANIKLSGIIFSMDKDFVELKSRLNNINPSITFDSKAKDDFLTLVKSTEALNNLLLKSYKTDDRLIVPASILINNVEKSGKDTALDFKVNEKDNTVDIVHSDGSNKENNEVDQLIKMAADQKILDDFILSEDVLPLVQSELFAVGVYPKIYLKNWEYSYIKDKEDLLTRSKNVEKAEDLFNEYKKENEIEDLDEYTAYSFLNISNKINSSGFLAYSPTSISKNINENSVAKIEETIAKNSGFEVVQESNRFYPNRNTASHMVGYTGSISEAFEIAEFVEYKKYDLSDNVGKSGLEESFEDTLRGSKGKRLVYTDVYGRTTDVIEETKAIPGNNLYSTIDLDFQREVENILDDLLLSIQKGTNYQSYYGPYSVSKSPSAQIASAVVMNTKTGEILAMVSRPDYDPNLFVNGITATDWKKLNDTDPKDIYAPRPIMNNVLQSAFTPGSTFKTVTSLAALEKGLDANNRIDNYGFIQIGSNKFNDLIYTRSGGRWGNLNLYDALKVSSNYYFYVLGLGYNPNKPGDNDVKVTLEDIESMTKRLGLQDKTGVEINYPTESKGYHPSLVGKKTVLRAGLNGMLRRDLKNYIKEGVKKSENELNNDIATILSWIETGPDMPKGDVIKGLESMKYDSNKRLNNERESLFEKIKYNYLNMAKWTQGDSLNMVIGQGQNAYTPMQMVQLASIIANDGKLVHPTLISKIKNYNNTEDIFNQNIRTKETGVDSKYFADVKEGMRRVSEKVRYRSSLPFEVGSKTGTAEVDSIDPKTGENYKDIISEISFAPFKDPEIAVYVSIVEGKSSPSIQMATNDIIYAYYKYVKDNPSYSNQRPGEKNINFKNKD